MRNILTTILHNVPYYHMGWDVRVWMIKEGHGGLRAAGYAQLDTGHYYALTLFKDGEDYHPMGEFLR